MNRELWIGDRVAYSGKFLRSIGCYAGEMPSARGRIIGLTELGPIKLASIDWGGADLPKRVQTGCLVLVGSHAFMRGE